MKIGVNYLLESKELYEEGKIDFVDYFKLYSLNGNLDGIDWCVKHKGFMFHGTYGEASSIGDADLIKSIDIEKTKSILEKSCAPFLSIHLYMKSKEQTEEETYEAIKQNIADFKRTFGKNILLENVPYRAKYSHCEFLFKPEVINRIVHENDVGFLFDISHARKSAEYFGMSFEEYVSKLPMDRVVEFHLAGMYYIPNPQTDDLSIYSKKQIEFIKKLRETHGNSYDNHGKLNEEDYSFLKKAVKEFKTLEYITLEYGSCHLKLEFEGDDYTYPVCSFDKINPKAKEEVLEQLTRIKQIIMS